MKFSSTFIQLGVLSVLVYFLAAPVVTKAAVISQSRFDTELNSNFIANNDSELASAAYKLALVFKDNKLEALNLYYNSSELEADKAAYTAYLARLLQEFGFLGEAADKANEAIELGYSKIWFYEYFAAVFSNTSSTALLDRTIEAGLKLQKSEVLLWLKARNLATKDPEAALQIISELEPSGYTLEIVLTKYALQNSLKLDAAAEQTLLDAEQQFPSSPEVYEQLLLFYSQKDEHSKFFDKLTEAQNKYPDQPSFHYFGAVAYSSNKEASKAIKEIDLAVKLEPANPNYRVEQARLYISDGKADQAQRMVEELLALNQFDYALLIWLSRQYISAGRPFDAEQVLLRGLERLTLAQADGSELYRGLILEYAVVQEAIHNNDQAIEVYKSLKSNQENQQFLTLNIARARYNMEQYEAALAEINDIIASLDIKQNRELAVLTYRFSIELNIQLKDYPSAQRQLLEVGDSLLPDIKYLYQARIYLYYKNFSSALKQIKLYQKTNNADLERSLYIELAALDGTKSYKSLLEKLENNNRAKILSKYIILAKQALKTITPVQALNELAKNGMPDLATVELAAYVEGTYKQRQWPSSVKTAFEAIWKDRSFDFKSVPQEWLPYLQTLEHSIMINTEVNIAEIPLAELEFSWMKIYQHYNYMFLDIEPKFKVLEDQESKIKNDFWLNAVMLNYFVANDQNDLCITSAQQYLKRFSDSVWARIEMSICYDNKKESKLALSNLNEALEFERQNPTVLNNLAWIYLTSSDPQLIDPKKALGLALQATKLEQSSSAFWDTLAEAYFQLKQYDEARLAIQKAVVVDRRQSDYYKKQIYKIISAMQGE